MITYFVRHGLIRSNVDNVYSGRSVESLTDMGALQAEELGKKMRGWRIPVIYTSPLRRTIQTAEILNKHIGARLVEDVDLIEMDLGPWTGLSKDEVLEKYPDAYRTWVETPAFFKWGAMETLESVQERVVRFLQRLREMPSHESAVAVTHAVVVKCAYLHCNRLSLNSYHSIPVPNVSLYELTMDSGGCGMEKLGLNEFRGLCMCLTHLT